MLLNSLLAFSYLLVNGSLLSLNILLTATISSLAILLAFTEAWRSSESIQAVTLLNHYVGRSLILRVDASTEFVVVALRRRRSFRPRCWHTAPASFSAAAPALPYHPADSDPSPYLGCDC